MGANIANIEEGREGRNWRRIANRREVIVKKKERWAGS